MAELVLHVLPPSHPSWTAMAALDFKGLEYERVDLAPGKHNADMEALYGEGKTTVPGMLVDGEPVHGSVAILARLEELAPEPTLYPVEIADAVREAELWGNGELQDLGRRLSWGAMHFRPEAVGTFGGAGPLDGPGTDFAIRVVHAAWKYHGISAERLANDLAGLPGLLDQVDGYVGDGLMGGETPTAADLQIGATLAVFLTIGDLRPLLAGRPLEQVPRRWFADYPGEIPAGAYPAGWVPTA